MYLWGRGASADIPSSPSSSSSLSSTWDEEDLRSRYTLEYWEELYGRLRHARDPRSFDQEEVVRIVRLIAQLLMLGEGMEDERMFEFFGQRNLLPAFCQMTRCTICSLKTA
ncbi:hypothetical protein Naga_100911g1 [Nannochloropsis gaditana]|uniref:Uncharacterized protein n=1 Tax=Nannochloropsis gaditana TaxID=72520 RepID=W7TBC0_9STRA|nr:hypothetical protein Naga_100911g1 [Nannochloropsis gaditana]